MSLSIVRSLRRAAVLLILLAGSAGMAAMVQPVLTGKIQGTVRDQTGAPIANAQVTIVGTAFGALTNNRGYYFFNNVPSGRVSVRAAFVGYKSTEVQGVEVLSGHTVTQDIQLEQTPFQVDEITITAAGSPLVPRDEVTTKQRISGDYVDPTIRGGRTDQGTIYIEGVPVAPGYRGTGFRSDSGVQIGVNGFEEASVTTGAVSGEFGNAQSGIVNEPDPRTYGERYAAIYDNAFLASRDNPLSTFSIDVDAASYSNVRRFLTNGQAPPPAAVRIEEMINYFDYQYAEPRGSHPFSVTTEVTSTPWNPRHQLVLIGLQGRRMATAELPPSNLVFLIDVSGSMASPDKLPLVQSAFRLLVHQLGEADRVAIVVYAGAAGLVLPSTPGSRKELILEAIDRLSAGGSTAGGAGIHLAYQVAQDNFIEGGNNRVILATDGDFNVGVTDDAELVRLIEEKRKAGTFLSVLGFGTGNLQDARMEQLADKGNGNYSYIDNLNEARKVFVHQMRGTLFAIAKDVKIQIEFNPALVESYRLIGYENRLLRAEDFNDDLKDAGELGAGHSVTALYEVVPVGAGVDSLRYQASAAPPVIRHTDELLTVKLRYKEPDGETSRLLIHTLQAGVDNATENLRFASAVAAFGMILRNSEHRGSADPALVLRLARAATGEDEFGYREEFIRLVESFRQTQSTALNGVGR